MDTCREPSTPADCSELLWDADGHGTAQAGDVSFAAGDGTAWPPERLLGLAVGSSLMAAFLGIARRAGLTVLAYASQQHVERREDATRPEIVLSPCVTVASSDDAVLARAALDHAFAQSAIAAALTWPVRMEPHVVVLPREPADCEW